MLLKTTIEWLSCALLWIFGFGPILSICCDGESDIINFIIGLIIVLGTFIIPTLWVIYT